MKAIGVLILFIAAAVWFFHLRSPRSAPSATMDQAPINSAAQAVREEGESLAENARRQKEALTRAVYEDLIRGKKLREQPNAAPAAHSSATTGLTPHDRILHGERFLENKRAATQ